MKVDDDEDAIRRVRSGDAGAFTGLAERHYPACFRFAHRYLGHREDAEEVVQDAMVRAFRALDRGAAPRDARPWLLQIVRNRARALLARRDRRRRLLERWWPGGEPGREPAVDPRADADEVGPRLRRALADLSPPLREAFLLKHVEELTYEEMAEVTGARTSALKMRVKRAADGLRRSLRGEGDR